MSWTALNDYQKALHIDGNSHCAQNGVPHVQKLQKLSSRRDYYKILGVKRTASKKEIIKAYRKLAQKWHPDGYQGDEKKQAEKKFIDIAAAKEVLTNPGTKMDTVESHSCWLHLFTFLSVCFQKNVRDMTGVKIP